MRFVNTAVYQFDELSEESKERAVEEFRDMNVDHEWWDSVCEEVKKLGIKVKSFDTYRGDIEIEIDLFEDAFLPTPEYYSNEEMLIGGAIATFNSTIKQLIIELYYYQEDFTRKVLAKTGDETPEDIQYMKEDFFEWVAPKPEEIDKSPLLKYLSVDSFDCRFDYPDTEEEKKMRDESRRIYRRATEAFEDAMKEIKHQVLNILRNEYEYLTSDEAVIDTIKANEYEFTEDGKFYC